MDVMGFFQPASPPDAGRLRRSSSGLGAGIRVQGPVLEGRLSVRQALALAGAQCHGGSTRAHWNRAEVDRFWLTRDSVFGD